MNVPSTHSGGDAFRERKQRPAGDWPMVTVIMPVRNEANFIHQSLGAVLGQDYPGPLEVLVADGCSDDGTPEAVLALGGQRGVRIIENLGRIVPTGMNAALREAKGEIVVRVDGHCVIAPDYVRRCVEQLETGADGVGGPMETVGQDELSQAIAVAMSSGFGVGGSAFRTVSDQRMWVETVPFPAYRMETIRRLGEYDEEMVRNQDDEYNYRLIKSGGRILLSPDIRSRYYSRSSLRKLWKQYFQYGFWKVRVLQKHPRQLRLRQFVPPAFVAALGGSALLAPFSRLGRYLLAGTAGLYVLANLSASVKTASRRGWGLLPRLPVLFAILHLAYGSGFIVGLVRFINRWKKLGGSS